MSKARFKQKKLFFDIHFHAMNLSHPYFLAFIKRTAINIGLFLHLFPVIGTLSAMYAMLNKSKIANLLYILDRDISNFFLLLEEELKSENFINRRNKFEFAGKEYDKIIITPLMMDFGDKNTDDYPDCYYKQLYKESKRNYKKSIVEQTIDLLNGIRKYEEEKNKIGIFEIYPFLGLNPYNYKIATDKQHDNCIPMLLKKYFNTFDKHENPVDRYSKLFKKRGTFHGDIGSPDPQNSKFNHLFAGIKVYPPLRFDPWPKDPINRDRVKLLYDYCIKKNIPLVTHCGGNGYCTIKERNESWELTSPDKWENVLTAQKKYKKLKINLAHFGTIKNNTKKMLEWRDKIIYLITHYQNVYTDISGICYKPFDYKFIEDILKKHPGRTDAPYDIRKKILFGTDFFINLLETKAYHEYYNTLKQVKDTYDWMDDTLMDLFCCKNPHRFLFG